MQTPLLSHRMRLPGALLALTGMALGVASLFGGFEPNWLDFPVPALYADEIFGDSGFFRIVTNNVVDEMGLVLSVLGWTMLAFSAEAKEDEFTLHLRLKAVLWAVGVNSLILLLSTLFFYGSAFFYVLIGNCLTVLILMVLRFRWLIYTSNRHEE